MEIPGKANTGDEEAGTIAGTEETPGTANTDIVVEAGTATGTANTGTMQDDNSTWSVETLGP